MPARIPIFSIDNIYRYMTQSVVEKTSIAEKPWRRQTDSPTWWIAFAGGSLILHLLAFWLISIHKLSASQSGSDLALPIEFIEISPQKSSSVQPQTKPKPKPKPVTPKPVKPIVPQNSKPAVKPPVSTFDRDAIAFNNQKIEQKLADQQRQQELLQQQQLADQQRQQELAQRQQLAEQQRQRQAQQEQLEAQLRQRQEQHLQLEAQLRQQEIDQ
ncbi:MAG: hypothetical protein WBA39_03710, partial [Rivularia sp. (in: cyanobacteria)]